MIRSLRWRLQLWYALVLLVVVAGFAGLLYQRVQAARLEVTDEVLGGAARYLDAHLRPFPPDQLWGSNTGEVLPPLEPTTPLPPKRKGPGPDRKPPRKGPPKSHGHDPNLYLGLFREGFFAFPEEAVAEERAYFAVWRRDDSLLCASGRPPSAPPLKPSDLTFTDDPEPLFCERAEHRLCTYRGPGGARILVGMSMQKDRAELRALAWQLAGTGGLVLAGGLFGGWLASRRVLRPIDAMATTARTISETNLSERIRTQDIDTELRGLAEVLNATFAGLEQAFERQKRFTADASHELRTPLAIVQAHVELALARARSEAEYRETLNVCLQATARMRALVDGLLTLARADAGRLELAREKVDLGSVVAETVALHGPQAAQAGVELAIHLPESPCLVLGDAGCLERVLANLLTNALRHTPKGGRVSIALVERDGHATLTVADTGCGIPEEHHPHVFERFYRADHARDRESGGNGLGLAICKCLVEAHGGTIRFDSAEGKGTTFEVRVPVAEGRSN